MRRFVLLSSIVLAAILISTGCKNKHKPVAVKMPGADTTTKFLFAGKEGSRKAVYVYDLVDKEYEVLWTSAKEAVVDLGTNESHEFAYFITVTQAGKQGILPYFLNARMYITDLKTLKVVQMLKLGHGVQLAASFETDSTISVAINRVQASMVSHIMQQKYLFSTKGGQIAESSRVFDFTKDGYPPLPPEKVRLLSPGKIFSLDLNDKNAVLLHGGVENPKLLAGESGQRLHSVVWSRDGETLVFSTVNLTSSNKTLRDAEPQTATLYVFSLADNAMQRIFRGSGYKHFDVIGDIVIYDDNFGVNSRIHLFSLKEKKEIGSIHLPGGCGLQNIPELPDYGL